MTELDTNMVRTWHEHDTNKTHFGNQILHVSYPEKALPQDWLLFASVVADIQIAAYFVTDSEEQ